MKTFNTTGICDPQKHYMVNIDSTIDKMEQMVEAGTYFTVNRGRQYGKTTTLNLLKKRLEKKGYIVFFISFEGLGNEAYSTSERFFQNFFEMLDDEVSYGNVKGLADEQKDLLENVCRERALENGTRAIRLISDFCKLSESKIVLIIDEVDQAGNHEAFIDFLGLLRAKFLKRDEAPTFRSVILAGVYDIKNLKLKVRSDEEHQYNSPWNVAESFQGDMSLSADGIKDMLDEYAYDHDIKLDSSLVADYIRSYTSGYPFLVCRLCRLMDEMHADGKENAWTKEGFLSAEKRLLAEQNAIFDDIRKKMAQFPELRNILYGILFDGDSYSYNVYSDVIDVASMFGFVGNKDGETVIANRIFETWLYDYFVSEDRLKDDGIYRSGSIDKKQFVKNGELNMRKVLERFIVHYTDIYGDRDERFHEKEGRKYFLFYLKPIINGTGNYYIEAETRDETRTDVIVDYLGKQYVVELKIWRGNSYNERGEKQLSEYLDYYHLSTGYMLSFNFNENKEQGIKEVIVGDKVIIEAVV